MGPQAFVQDESNLRRLGFLREGLSTELNRGAGGATEGEGDMASQSALGGRGRLG